MPESATGQYLGRMLERASTRHRPSRVAARSRAKVAVG